MCTIRQKTADCMPSNGVFILKRMLSFDDFDAWADAVSGASLRLVCDSVETRRWTLGMVPLGDVALQVASEGGGNLCYGENTHSGPMLFVPLSHAAAHVVNTEPLDDDACFFIPHGTDFRIQVRRHAHAWCSIALPTTYPVAAPTARGSGRVACHPGSVQRLRHLVHRITDALMGQPGQSEAHRVAGRDLFDAVTACLPTPEPARAATGRPRLDRAQIIRQAMAVIDAAPTTPTARMLAAHVGVTDRTLLRAFRETYGVPPKRYLLFRELHGVRRILCAGAPHDDSVADVLTRHGIWEFGRFAARYRRHFGELPSVTLRRSRG
jgi:AraC family ethanolamine operon transcriptional activator